MSKFNTERFLRMMTLTRRHDSVGEEVFVDKYILPLNPEIKRVTCHTPGNNHQDEIGAYVVEVADNSGAVPPILFSAHVDTVHSPTAPEIQVIHHDSENGYVYKDDGIPLGADNAAGCAVLMHMIENGVPGAYIFHRGEECGGVGSQGMADDHEEWLKRFKWAIAFDRRGTDSIITEMMVGQTASEKFAEKFAELLNADTRFSYRPDPTGSFTDTANYAHIIPECTNVSVGYDHEHTKDETMDLWHIEQLAEKLVQVFARGPEVIGLPVVREAKAPVWSKGWWGDSFYLSPKGNGNDLYDFYDADSVVSAGFKEVADFVRSNWASDVAALIMDLAERVQELEQNLAEQDMETYRLHDDVHGDSMEPWDRWEK